MKAFVTLVMAFSPVLFVNAQQTTCEVKMDGIKGKYEGDCAKDKAHGMGVAVGVDQYEGSFKNGYPDGIGRYNWKNGNYYFGAWKKGMREGKGEMHIMVDGRDSMITGYWKKDKYSGEYENPFIITNTTSDIGRIQVNNLKGTQRKIMLTVESLINGGPGFGAPAKLTGVQVIRGTYMSKSSNTLTNKDVTIFQNVIFPFRAIFNFGSSIVEMEFYEEGDWDVMVPIGK